LRGGLVLAIGLSILPVVGFPAAFARSGSDPTSIALDVPRQDVVMGDDIGRTDWSTRLAHPSAEGQFEILVRKSATDIRAPDCKSRYLVIRMPASVSIGVDPATEAAVARKQAYYNELMAAYQKGEPLHAQVFAGPYGKRNSNGQLVLTECNLFFVAPTPRH
jgi:hypothetical protein